MGWFYGFKLHLVVNEYGEILSFQLTPAMLMTENLYLFTARLVWQSVCG